MASYANGRFPLNKFVHRGGNIYLTPSLNARWNEMVRLGVDKYGVRLYITGDIDGLGGWNGYRPYDPQVAYRAHYGIMAALPGTSSHGGIYQNREVFALDIANVGALAPGNQSLANARLTALAKMVGLTVNFVRPTEWWHVGDFNNAWVVPTFGRPAINPGTTNKPKPEASQEDDEMKGLYYTRKSDGATVHALFNDNSGFWVEFTGTNPHSNSQIAGFWQTGSWANVTESVAGSIKRATLSVLDSSGK